MSHGVAAGVGFIILVASGAPVASSSTQDEPEVSPTKARARDVYDVLRPIYEEASRVVAGNSSTRRRTSWVERA